MRKPWNLDSFIRSEVGTHIQQPYQHDNQFDFRSQRRRNWSAQVEILAQVNGSTVTEPSRQSAMASSSNPYEHYNSPHVEDDGDLIDPDDGMDCTLVLLEF
jgi:hypothetical protein